jgi:hypothetical protein
VVFAIFIAMSNQEQIDEDHRLALELANYPTSTGDVESNGYHPVGQGTSIPAQGYTDYDANQCAGGSGDSNRGVSFTTDQEYPVARSSPPDDWTLARALQALEFEIAAEIDPDDDFETLEEHDFRVKEVRASGCRRQLATFSAFSCLVYLAVFIASTQIQGIAPQRENPMIGPPVVVLVRFGAKEASLQ